MHQPNNVQEKRIPSGDTWRYIADSKPADDERSPMKTQMRFRSPTWVVVVGFNASIYTGVTLELKIPIRNLNLSSGANAQEPFTSNMNPPKQYLPAKEFPEISDHVMHGFKYT